MRTYLVTLQSKLYTIHRLVSADSLDAVPALVGPAYAAAGMVCIEDVTDQPQE